jgi:putative zinc finger/helix-turn-helix YgiT family protein
MAKEKMKCFACRAGLLKVSRETVKYSDCGLSTVTLSNVEVRACGNCGEREVVLPKIEELHRLIASLVANKPARLTSAEFRFLRKYLGFSGADFARYIDVQPETLSRWENGKTPINMSVEWLVRHMALTEKPIERYPVNPRKAPSPQPVVIRADDGDWTAATVSALRE